MLKGALRYVPVGTKMVPPEDAAMRARQAAHAASLSEAPSPMPPQSRTKFSSSAPLSAQRSAPPTALAFALASKMT